MVFRLLKFQCANCGEVSNEDTLYCGSCNLTTAWNEVWKCQTCGAISTDGRSLNCGGCNRTVTYNRRSEEPIKEW